MDVKLVNLLLSNVVFMVFIGELDGSIEEEFGIFCENVFLRGIVIKVKVVIGVDFEVKIEEVIYG